MDCRIVFKTTQYPVKEMHVKRFTTPEPAISLLMGILALTAFNRQGGMYTLQYQLIADQEYVTIETYYTDTYVEGIADAFLPYNNSSTSDRLFILETVILAAVLMLLFAAVYLLCRLSA
ncbi:hypothetical protein ECE50_002005 [Chitinophaga sp. Mgbs1]|uniref:Uncharacterized protein n=1 Tax=Chitinophaga solisilvae TaxID=1233460 RepID=A0A9Q5D5Z1_9BACT|nr:hypothetical protein [Chitinophaga solisilvae]